MKKYIHDNIEFHLGKNKKISINSPTFIIAEIGINHEGSASSAEKLVDRAFKAGADAVKFQIVNPEHSYDTNTNSYKIYKNCQLSEIDYRTILKKFRHKGIIFATPGDINSLELCNKLKFNLYKVSSGLLTNLPLIKAINKTKKSIILSTGMATIDEIDEVFKIIKNKKKISVLHAISIYPASILNINLNSVKYIEKKYKVISGYSDHCIGWEACKLAVTMGAKIIEKHFTLDNKRKGFDHKISLNPKNFKQMVNDIRRIEQIVGTIDKKPYKEELKVKDNIVRYCVASKDIFKGEKINISNTQFKRINHVKKGLKAYNFNLINETISKRNYKKNELIK